MKTFASIISLLLFASAVVAAPTGPTLADQVEPPNEWAEFGKRDVATSDVVSAPQNWGGLEQKREEALKGDKVWAPHNWGGFEQKREESGTGKADVITKVDTVNLEPEVDVLTCCI